MIDRSVAMARRFADGMRAAGFSVLNDVVLNQVLVDFGDREETLRVVQRLQADGTMFAGPTVWQGHTAMRISVSNYGTTEVQVDDSIDAVLKAVNS
jgi:glutamate/tyrosine decarboxylase-like PLP-dependent enzyme